MDAENQEFRPAQEKPFRMHGHGGGPDWLIWLGLVTTITYLGVLAIYVAKSIGWANIGNAPIEIMGNFLEGAFAPPRERP